MNDIELSEITHDIVFEGADIKLLNNEAQVSKQTLKINLLFYKGEWFLDNTYGVPYFQEILGKINNTTLPDTIIIDKVLKSYNIASLESMDSTITSDRAYVIDNIKATTVDGDIISISTGL